MNTRTNTINIAINGAGRIGRLIIRALYENPSRYKGLKIVAVNDLADVEIIAYLLQQDTVHGAFQAKVEVDSNQNLVINGDCIRYEQKREPETLPWDSFNIDVVHECTGLFTKHEQAKRHLQAGAKKVLISAPSDRGVDATIVYGINHKDLRQTDCIVSNASCTTNCLVPLVKVLGDAIGIKHGFMTTLHAYTNDQSLLDSPHRDFRRARAAGCSMIPTRTGAASAVGLVLPELEGKLDGLAVRVPTANVSLVDFTFSSEKKSSAEAINACLKKASEESLKDILVYSEKPWVSIDYNHNPASSIVDASQTRVIDNMVKVLAWYDNEWGFSNRMLDTTRALMEAD